MSRPPTAVSRTARGTDGAAAVTSATWTGEEELYAKRQRVQDALHRIGGSGVSVEAIYSGEPLHYRNKSQYPVSADGQVGFTRRAATSWCPWSAACCKKPPADAAADALRRYIETYRVPGYDEKDPPRPAAASVHPHQPGGAVADLRAGQREEAAPRAGLMSLLRQAVPETVGVVLGVNTQPTGAILGGEYRTLWGEDVLTDRLCGLTFRLSVPSFYQVNHDMAEVLYRTALDFAGLTGTETVLDLYCGSRHHHAGDGAAGGARHRRGDRPGGHCGRQGERPAATASGTWSSSAATHRRWRRTSPPEGCART